LPQHFAATNDGKWSHGVIIIAADAVEDGDGDQSGQVGLVHIAAGDLGGCRTGEMDLIFDKPPSPSDLESAVTDRQHYETGMHLATTVK
jgi:hypothetical protein